MFKNSFLLNPLFLKKIKPISKMPIGFENIYEC
jgi:hypothetical protein